MYKLKFLFGIFCVGIAIFALTACGANAEGEITGMHDYEHDHAHSHSHHDHDHDHLAFEFYIHGEYGHINVYSSRHFAADEQLFRSFTEATGIGVNVIYAGSGQFVERLRIEGSATPADLIITEDGGVISHAKSIGLLQSVNSDVLNQNIPLNFRDNDNYWFALSYRARVLAVAADTLSTNIPQTYQDLASGRFDVLLRPGGHIYNISLLASLIDIYGYDYALRWAMDVFNSRARNPQGNDRDQAAAIAAGIGDIALINSYYLGLLLSSNNPEEVMVGQNLQLIFPNQQNSGTHINISAMAVPYYSSNLEGAVSFMEFATDVAQQSFIANANYEFPVNDKAEVPYFLREFMPFEIQNIDFATLYENHILAVQILNIVGW